MNGNLHRPKRDVRRSTGIWRALVTCVATVILLAPSAKAIDSETLLDELTETGFRYFWEQANPGNGLIKDRSTPTSPCSIASVGFGLSAICVGVDHGWVSREDARVRVLTTLNTFWNGPQGSGQTGYIGYKGLFYHFLDMNTALRTWSCEVSTIDSALLFAGMLHAREYFGSDDPVEVQLRGLVDSIYQRADWNFFRNFNQGVLMGWKPGTGFSGFGQWIGYNEAMILYILALGSPTYPVPETAWNAWTSGYDWGTWYGQDYVYFPPLFGHQYSHCWIDFRYIQDAYMRNRGITYFENSRRATLAQREYCIDNPLGWEGYGSYTWGLTACDGPNGYNARGAPPAQNDDGTIAPTAVAGSIPFAPEATIPTLVNFYDTHGGELWSTYGFKDAFNLTQNWWDSDYIGIDEGPIVLMIANHRGGRIWDVFMRNADVQRGLTRAGFSLAAGAGDYVSGRGTGVSLFPCLPNPFRGGTSIHYTIPDHGNVRLWITDAGGRSVAMLVDRPQDGGEHVAVFRSGGLPSGVYFSNLRFNSQTARLSCVLVR
jgi:hypothetical protein